MRVIAVLCLATALSASSAHGQSEAATGGFASGGVGGPVVKFSQLLDQFAVFAGARGGWIANHSFVIGGGVYTLVNTVDRPGGASI